MQGVLLVLLIVLAWIPTRIQAWDNYEVHPEMNKLALELFKERVIAGEVRDLYYVSLDGEPCRGVSWEKKSDGIRPFKQFEGIVRIKSLKQWIEEGGFSADEPEAPMALRHFYNPFVKVNDKWIIPADGDGEHYLTDEHWILRFQKWIKKKIPIIPWDPIENPRIDAVQWAKGEQGIPVDTHYMWQIYSWPDAKRYFKYAVEQSWSEPDYDNEFYGKAWRAVGETMHLVEDMALPSHVRNDGHFYYTIGGTTLFDPDPLEQKVTKREEVGQYYSDNWSDNISYDQTPTKLMKDLAAWTNKNFLSKDTIPIPWEEETADEQPEFPSPILENNNMDEHGYFWGIVDKKPTILARQSELTHEGFTVKTLYMQDKKVMDEQLNRLIPTAVRAAEAVIERFLPRFKAEIISTYPVDENGQYTNQYTGKYMVKGALEYTPTDEWKEEWPNGPVIRNGVYVVIYKGSSFVEDVIPVQFYNKESPQGKKIGYPDKDEEKEPKDLSHFRCIVPAKIDDLVKVRYDLGGYVIESKYRPFLLPNPEPPFSPTQP